MSHFKFPTSNFRSQISDFKSENCKLNQGKRARLGRGSSRGSAEPIKARFARHQTRRPHFRTGEGNRDVGAIACVRGGRASQSAFCVRLSLHEGSQLSA